MKKHIIILVLILTVACDVLTTREPEEPTKARLDFTAPVSPEILFENLKKSFENKSIENYLSCLVDETYLEKAFKFYPSSKSLTIDPKLSDWTLVDEEQYFFNLIKSNENNSLTLQLSNEQWNSLNDYRSYRYDYLIVINNSFDASTELFQGSLQFDIYQDSRNFWVITEWRDIQLEDFKSWSELKGGYY